MNSQVIVLIWIRQHNVIRTILLVTFVERFGGRWKNYRVISAGAPVPFFIEELFRHSILKQDYHALRGVNFWFSTMG